MECKYIAIIDGKTYTYANASQVFILEDAISIGVDEEILKAFVNKVFDLYLSDSNDTPLDKLIDYCHEHWNEFEDKSRWEILDDFYSSF